MTFLKAMGTALCIATLATSAMAETIPQSLPAASQIKQFVYNEYTVYRLDLHTNFISTVQFGRGENVQSIQVGDSASWQIIRLKRGDVISIKPFNSDAITNMTIYTDRRVYTFELHSHAGSGRRTGGYNYRTTFQYPTPVVAQFSDASSLSSRNYDYNLAGSADFAPTSVYDDGKQTYFVFDSARRQPGVFKVGQGGQEYTVNSRTAGSTLIVDGVSDRWTVRIGGEAICVASSTAAARYAGF
ncbi:TrbG/VirB9 family P-type conjugative transfer protein [Roseibium sediminicola]|uniref:TrbG/VirB9 family P-type conjugative transfer protein n=1 Tax=Roseibium sediminicola TaxID=2933272 RepID=A0ABT0H425_9HYPH|nr:TrbG/VirB9 family P-type conjugative transfer protein [Roseibium sp. CAU 1639]MCK7616215.1 TrbG/VirB9 family P-type conjugative transfer protein [Roseibium sp. CAU 1639]